MKNFTVKIHGRAGLTYKDESGSVDFDSEMLTGKFDMVIYVSYEAYWGGDRSMPVSSPEKARIIENLKDYMLGKGIAVDWQ